MWKQNVQRRIKFSDKIEEQQKIPNKLRLQQQLRETLAQEAVYEEALKEQNSFDCDETDQFPKETEKTIDRFVNCSEFPPTLPTSTASLLSPLNENKGLPVTPFTDIGHPPPMGHSAYMTLTDTGLPTDSFQDKGHQVTSHPTTDTRHEAHFHADTPDQVKSFPELMKYPGKSYDYTGQPATSFPNTGLLAPIHLDTDYQITPQLPAPSANTGNLTTSYPFVLSKYKQPDSP